ncbi:MAG: hypothetical protein WBW84_14620 [Acidobacteriaceae bacterium]
MPEPSQFQIVVEVLLNEAEIAVLSLTTALAEGRKCMSLEAWQDARTIYESIRATRRELDLSTSESAALDLKVDRLRAMLRYMGEAV